jgi:RNA polymerase sigma-70 factor (ECF subfamily)
MSVNLLRTRSYVAVVRLAAAFLGTLQPAEDVVREVLSRTHAHLPRLNDPDAANRYLRVSVLNGARNALRDQHRRLIRDTAATKDERRDGTVVSAEVSAMRGLDRQHVQTAVLALPERQRDVALLCYLADLSINDKARTLNIGEGAVKTANTRALKALARILGGNDDP